MPSPLTKRVCIFLIFLGIIAGIVGTYRRFQVPNASSGTRDMRSSDQSIQTTTREDPLSLEATHEPTGATPGTKLSTLISNCAATFRTNPNSEQAVLLLRALRDGIRQAPEEEAAAAIVAFLKTGEDAATGLPFAVGPDGMMDVVPTVRLALLDLLPSLDPVVALEVARELMVQRTSADEFALALRNMAWNDLNGDLRDELSSRFSDLLKSPWLDQPSAGFLEAFDIAIEVGGSSMFDQMVALTGEATAKSNAPVRRAALMTLDRMIVRDGALLTAAYSADPGWMNFAPQQRASLMSRLDITQPGQQSVFSRYIAAPSTEAEELEYFAKIFPNQNFLYGHRLVTADDSTPTIAEVAASDAQVVASLNALEASATGEAGVTIRTIRSRLDRGAK